MDRDQHLQPNARQRGQHARRRLRSATAPLADQRAWLICDGARRVRVGGKVVGGSPQAMMRFGYLTDIRIKRGKQLAPLRWRG